MSNYKKLVVWQKANELAFKVYFLTNSFPKHELYGLNCLNDYIIILSGGRDDSLLQIV